MSKLTFNDHLDDMMERLMNEDISADDLELELKRSKALCQIAEKKIQDKKLALDFAEAVANGRINERMIPSVFTDEYKQIKSIQ